MAKAPVSAPDPHVESDEESADKETSSEEVHNDAGSDTESGSEPETESKHTDNAQKPVVDGENPGQQTSDSSSEDEGEGEAEADGDEEGDEEEDGEEEEDEESQSESESEGGRVTKSDPAVKPILSKPLDGAPGSKKGVSKPKTASLSSTSKKANPAAGDKRPATSETGGDGEVMETKRSYKRTKKEIQESSKKIPKTNSKPRKYFKRLWSEEDELAILKGMADFFAIKKVDPFINLDAFHEFIKKSIHVDVRKSQLQDKIRKMRMKYLNTADNENKGLAKAFNSDHDRKAFELSKKVWGNETLSGGISSGRSGRGASTPRINGDLVKRSTTKNVKSKKAAPVVTDVVVVVEEDAKGGHDLDGSSNGLEERLKSVNWGAPNLGIEEWSMQNSIYLVDGESRAEMDDKWKKFRAEEAELHCKRLDFLREEAKFRAVEAKFRALEAELQSKRLELLSEEAKLVADALKSSRG